MTILQNISLENYSTMGLGGIAHFLTEVHDRMEVLQALSWAQEHSLPALMIGGGSNIVWRDQGFKGLLIVNKIQRFEVFEEDKTNTYITVGSGEPWDSVVARTTARGLSGIECLSLVPGTAGATPIQNVGAYGQQISDTIVTIEAFDVIAKDFVTIPTSDCDFGYRTSRFKTSDRNRFYITAITIHLNRGDLAPPFYPSVTNYLEQRKITDFSPESIRQAVISIRREKLPDPTMVKNCGSFFGNPIVSEGQFSQLRADYEGSEEIPHWPSENGQVKLPAAWLIEKVGFKNVHDTTTGIATWAQQPLVLVNEHAKTTAHLLQFRDAVVDAVFQTFKVRLEQEPELLPLESDTLD